LILYSISFSDKRNQRSYLWRWTQLWTSIQTFPWPRWSCPSLRRIIYL